jgi:hypothetical protein
MGVTVVRVVPASVGRGLNFACGVIQHQLPLSHHLLLASRLHCASYDMVAATCI